MNDRPQRAVTMTLTIGADDREGMAHALEELAYRIHSGALNGPNGASGSPSCGYSYEFNAAEHPTHDEYIAQLNAYLDANKGDTP